ncbi:MAG: sigma-70 family RNA polymerase sigma factor, partial [Rhodothermales bacterium]
PETPLATREDLENAALLGLLQALNNYSIERETPFISYAYGRVRGALIDYLRSIDVLSQKRRRQLGQAQQAIQVLRQMLGTEPEDQDVADYLGVSLEEYHTLLVEAQSRFALSLYENAEDQQPVLETVPNDGAMEAFDQIDKDSMYDFVESLVSRLPERERNILALYYYENLTLREIGQILSLTEARISQILGKTLLVLRNQLERVGSRAA